MTEAEILAHLLTHPRPEDNPEPDTDGLVEPSGVENDRQEPTEATETHEDLPRGDSTDQDAADKAGADGNSPDGDPVEALRGAGFAYEERSGADAADDDAANDHPPGDTADAPASADSATGPASADSATGPASTDSATGLASTDATEDAVGEDVAVDPAGGNRARGGVFEKRSAPQAGDFEARWCDERVGTREGIEIRTGLATLLRLDERPGEIPGLGPVDAEVARRVVAAQRRGAEWLFAIVDDHGYLLLAGPLRRRPRHGDPPGAGPPAVVRGGVVELHLTLAELQRLGTDPGALGAWAGVFAEITDRWAERHRLWRRLSEDPGARFARGALARHVRVRDRTCVGPGCTRSARRSDLDHTREHGRGGATVDANIGPGCWRHHPDKARGWTLTQPEPGHFVWKSPLGRTYRTQGEPIRPDLPEPEPPPESLDPREDPKAMDEAALICGSCGDHHATRPRRPYRNPTGTMGSRHSEHRRAVHHQADFASGKPRGS